MSSGPPLPSPFTRLPHNLEVERGVVGCLLNGLHPELCDNGLTADDFVAPEHARIFRAACEVRAAGGTPDFGTIWQRVQSSAALPDGDGYQYLRAIANNLASPANWRHYANDVRDCAQRRRLIELAEKLRTAAEAGEDTAPILAEMAEAGAGRGGDLRAVRADLLTVCTEPDLITGVLPADGLALIVGASQSGKSFIAIDLGMSVARGVPWRGRNVLAGAVLYVAAEGGRRFANRVAAYLQHHGCGVDVPFYVIAGAVDMLTGTGVPAVIAEARRIASEAGLPVRLVIVDTLSRAMPGGDENDPQDMGAAIANLERVGTATGGTVAAVHHLGKDASKGARGHSSLFAAADGELTCTKDGDRSRTLKVTKSRDGETGDRFGFTLQVVETTAGPSCVAVECDAGADAKREPTGIAKAALDVLRDVLARHGRRIEVCDTHVPAGVSVVGLALWRDHLQNHGITNKDGNARQQWARIQAKLRDELRLIGVWKQDVWIVP